MGLIEKLIDRGESSPKTAIAALLGIIVVGGVGGSIWIGALNSKISGLQSELQEREAMEKIRIEAAKSEALQDTKRLLAVNDFLSREIKALKVEVGNLQEEAGKVHEGLKPLAAKSKFGPDEVVSVHAAFGAMAGVVKELEVVVHKTEWTETILANIARN